jgi:2-aminobenzoate-CoA ligase
MFRKSAHVDTFARDNLPPAHEWPVLTFELDRLAYPDRMNCGAELLDRALRRVGRDKPAILQGDRAWTYGQLADEANRIAHALRHDLGVVPGSRVLLRGANGPELFAAWLAVMKAGAIAVTTMPMLKTGELRPIVEKGAIALALCQHDLLEQVEPLVGETPLRRVVAFGAPFGELETLASEKPTRFDAVDTAQDDVCLIAFTSGTTGEPKATMHFHRDVMAMCDTFAAHMLQPTENAVFSGTPPIAFTFGLGALLVFPLYFNVTIALPDAATPPALAAAVERHRATHLFTSPTGYRAILQRREAFDLSSLRVCVSAGEHLNVATSDAWLDATGIRLIDGIGATEMIHIFLSAAGDDIRPGAVGKPVPGFSATLLADDNQPIAGPGMGRLAVRGPTGCRYMTDPRQRAYVVNGWNVTGDVFRRDADGYYWYVARTDDMIVSSGYNIAGPEVEAVLATHPDVLECAVVGWPDAERGQVVKAVVVPRAPKRAGAALGVELQAYVKAKLAPYKYPRLIEFRDALPRTTTGKLQRSALRADAGAEQEAG